MLAFGNVAAGSIHGFKFLDSNRNGLFDTALNERGQADVSFQLTADRNADQTVDFVAFTQSDLNGEFAFKDLLPGTYIQTETLPAGFVNSTPLTRTFVVQSGDAFVWRGGAANLQPPAAVQVDQSQTGSIDETTVFIPPRAPESRWLRS
ncbi:MAG: SdrD B-like domain-containing protein [Pirellulaceae bacterium]